MIYDSREWQSSTRCLFGVDRWKVEVFTSDNPVTVKGVSEDDAWDLADNYDGIVYRSRVWVFADGSELLDGWDEVVR